MGVYLSNIEMPRTHPITVEIYPDGTVLSKTVGRMDIHGTAVLVPPHGDLIDKKTVNLEDGPYEYQDWVEWALEQYLNAPTIIPAEEGET